MSDKCGKYRDLDYKFPSGYPCSECDDYNECTVPIPSKEYKEDNEEGNEESNEEGKDKCYNKWYNELFK